MHMQHSNTEIISTVSIVLLIFPLFAVVSGMVLNYKHYYIVLFPKKLNIFNEVKSDFILDLFVKDKH